MAVERRSSYRVVVVEVHDAVAPRIRDDRPSLD